MADRETIIAPSWETYEAAAEHINCGALSEAEYAKREATLTTTVAIGNRRFVSVSAQYGGPGGLPSRIGLYEIRAAQAHEQDDRTHRPPETFYHGRVFRSGGQRWRMVKAVELLPPAEPRAQKEQLEQARLF